MTQVGKQPHNQLTCHNSTHLTLLFQTLLPCSSCSSAVFFFSWSRSPSLTLLSLYPFFLPDQPDLKEVRLLCFRHAASTVIRIQLPDLELAEGPKSTGWEKVDGKNKARVNLASLFSFPLWSFFFPFLFCHILLFLHSASRPHPPGCQSS